MLAGSDGFPASSVLAASILGMLAAGCAAPDPPAERVANTASAPAPLAGTEWRLVQIQSMDDAIGTARPEDPSLYTLALGADGTVAMRLDCNRGVASWSATPASPNSGSIRFGPLATTRALCPPPTLEERIVRDMDYVRTYMLQDDRLYLSLMADGGIYAWEPLSAD